MRVVWTDEATSHLDGIYAFIALTSSVYARRLIDKIVSRADDLGDFPTMGRVLAKYNDPSIRELVVAPYTVVYLVSQIQFWYLPSYMALEINASESALRSSANRASSVIAASSSSSISPR